MNTTTAEIEYSASVEDALAAVKKAIRVRWEYYTHARPSLDEFTAAVGRALADDPQNRHITDARWTSFEVVAEDPPADAR